LRSSVLLGSELW